MACCLMAASHYLNQCWLTIKETFWHFFQSKFGLNTVLKISKSQIVFEIYIFKVTATSLRRQWVKFILMLMKNKNLQNQYSVNNNWLMPWQDNEPGPRLNIKMSSYQYRKSHCGDKTVVRSSYLLNGISYTGKKTSLYWISPLEPISV